MQLNYVEKKSDKYFVIVNEQPDILIVILPVMCVQRVMGFVLYSELDSFGSSTVPGHLRINIFVFPECQNIPTY